MSPFRLALLTTTALLLAGYATAARLPDTSTRRDARAMTPAAAAPAAPAWSNRSWLNAAAPVSLASLRGQVVLVNFWVFTCGNCTRSLPSLRAFYKAFHADGLEIVGIHTPEFPPYAGEHDKGNVQKALGVHDVTWPVAQDNDRATWDLYGVRYWPTFVLIDKQGRIRYTDVGEFHVGDATHRTWESRIRELLAE